MCLYSSTFKQKWKSFRQHIAHCTALDNVSAFTFRPLGSFCSQPLFFTFQCHSSKSQSPVRLTLDGEQGLVHLPRQKGLGQVPEELLEDGGHIVHADLLRQDHVRTAVEILAQLKYRQGSVCRQCPVGDKCSTWRTRFWLVPTLKMPTVLRPCSSRYLQTFDGYKEPTSFNILNLMQVVTMAGTQGWGFILSDGSPGSNNLIQIQNLS